jgi:hypothetical protein
MISRAKPAAHFVHGRLWDEGCDEADLPVEDAAMQHGAISELRRGTSLTQGGKAASG